MRVTTGLKGWRKDSGEWSWTPEITIEHDGIPQLMDSAEVTRINESLEQQREIIRGMVEAKVPVPVPAKVEAPIVAPTPPAAPTEAPKPEVKCIKCGTVCNERVSASTKKPYLFCPKCKDNPHDERKIILRSGGEVLSKRQAKKECMKEDCDKERVAGTPYCDEHLNDEDDGVRTTISVNGSEPKPMGSPESKAEITEMVKKHVKENPLRSTPLGGGSKHVLHEYADNMVSLDDGPIVTKAAMQIVIDAAVKKREASSSIWK